MQFLSQCWLYAAVPEKFIYKKYLVLTVNHKLLKSRVRNWYRKLLFTKFMKRRYVHVLAHIKHAAKLVARLIVRLLTKHNTQQLILTN